MKVYKWVSNKTKFLIAVQKLKKGLSDNGPKVSEKNIKEEYIKIGGLVLKEEENEDITNKTIDLDSKKDEKEPRANISDI